MRAPWTHGRLGSRVLLLVGVLTLAACGVAAPASPPQATSAPSVARPASFADWEERQGFGGGSGLLEIRRGAIWFQEHPGPADITSAMVTWRPATERLIAWLDQRPPTACWAGYHAEVRAGLEAIAAGMDRAQAEADAGQVSRELLDTLVAESEALIALAEPAGCE